MVNLLEKWELRLHTYMSSLTITQGNAINRISNTISHSVQFTHHFCCSPHTWNNETCHVEFGKSKWNWRSKVWTISTFISLIVTLTQIVMEYGHTFIFHEDSTSIVLFRRLQILGSITGVTLQLNTYRKPKKYKEFINQYLRFFHLIEQDRILPPAKFNRIFWVTRILVIFIFLILLYIPFAFVIFVGYPEVVPNIFSELLPEVFSRTSVPGRREHWNPFVAFGVGVLEVIVISQQAYHVLNYTTFVSIGSVSIVQLLQETKCVIAKSEDNLNSALLDLSYFMKLYRAEYLLCKRMNDWIASLVIPGIVSLGVAILVSINYTLITATTNGFQKLTLVFGELALVVCLGVCLHMASFLSFRSKECLRAMGARSVVFLSRYKSRRLRACRDCRSYFGSMFYFSQMSLLVFGLYIVDYTIQTVITFP